MKIWFLVFVFALSTGGIIARTSAAPLELITAEEAARPNLSAKKIEKFGGLGGLLGKAPEPGAPQIIVEKPEGGAAVATPFPVRVRFIPSSGSKINLRSFEIYVLKIIKISLLSRVKPYLTEKGINVPEAKVPPGTYNVQIEVADDKGRTGSTIQKWIVH